MCMLQWGQGELDSVTQMLFVRLYKLIAVHATCYTFSRTCEIAWLSNMLYDNDCMLFGTFIL